MAREIKLSDKQRAILAQAYAPLRQADERYRMVLEAMIADSLPCVIERVDLDDGIVYVADAAPPTTD